MKSTLSDNRELFNVKAFAATGLTEDQIPEGHFGIFNDETGLTVNPAVAGSLPKFFSFYVKHGGREFRSYDTMTRSCCHLQEGLAQPVTEGQSEIHEAVLADCKCMDGVTLIINYDETSMIDRDGLTWTHNDRIVSVSGEEMACYCSCTDTAGVYENHVLTMLLADKINLKNSPYYSAEVQNAETGAVITDVKAHVEANKEANTGEDEENYTAKLKLVIKAKPIADTPFNAPGLNYLYPRALKLNISAHVHATDKAIVFEKTQELSLAKGYGGDLRFEEWENFNNYTTQNYRTRTIDGFFLDLPFQFENGKQYNTVTFEYDSKKSGLEDVYEGPYKRFMVMLGTEDEDVFNKLKSLFTKPAEGIAPYKSVSTSEENPSDEELGK